MASIDLQHIALLIGKATPSIFSEYIDQVGNQALLNYRRHLQWGGKRGESLYTHILNGIQVLETLRPPLKLPDDEAKVFSPHSRFTISTRCFRAMMASASWR